MTARACHSRTLGAVPCGPTSFAAFTSSPLALDLEGGQRWGDFGGRRGHRAVPRDAAPAPEAAAAGPSTQSPPQPPTRAQSLKVGAGPFPMNKGRLTTNIPPPPRPISNWAKFFSGPSANQKNFLAPLAPTNLGQNFSSAPLAPLRPQHHRRRRGGGGGSPPHPSQTHRAPRPLDGALETPPKGSHRSPHHRWTWMTVSTTGPKRCNRRSKMAEDFC